MDLSAIVLYLLVLFAIGHQRFFDLFVVAHDRDLALSRVSSAFSCAFICDEVTCALAASFALKCGSSLRQHPARLKGRGTAAATYLEPPRAVWSSPARSTRRAQPR